MKTILSIIILILIAQGSIESVELFPVTPIQPYFIVNRLLIDGPTPIPAGIPNEVYDIKFNLQEELEQKLIEIELVGQSV